MLAAAGLYLRTGAAAGWHRLPRVNAQPTEGRPMATPPRLAPLLAQFDFARERLADRLVGPDVDSGNGVRIPIVGLTDEEYRREPVPGCWSIRPRAAGPGPGATALVGAGAWGRDHASPRPGTAAVHHACLAARPPQRIDRPPRRVHDRRA